MKPAFRLDQHPRRTQPLLTAPPAGYFEQLPSRIMARLPQPEPSAAGWDWLLALPAVWRTSLASSVLLTGFAASFWLSGINRPSGSSSLASLDAVPHAEMLSYLLRNEAHLEAADLAELTAATPGITTGMLNASAAEITDALDAQPTEDTFIL